MPARARLRQLVILPLLTLVVLLAASAFGPAGQAEAAGRHHHGHHAAHHKHRGHHHRGHHHKRHARHHAAHQSTKASGGRVEQATRIALGKIGDPYRYGATGPGAFDCSGLIYYSFRKAGIQVPRTSSAQAGRARRISKGSMHRGDLMFFSNGGGVYHAAIFLRWDHGRAQMLHSPRTGERVQRAFAWTSGWFGGTLR